MAIASSSDGTRLATFCEEYANPGDRIWIGKYEAGNWTWTDQAAAGSRYWRSIASSSDGMKLAACEYNGDIWTSADGGGNWTYQAVASSVWASIASSSDGMKLAACALDGDIWTSADRGVTWVDQTTAGSRYWASIASSSDGMKLAACDGNGAIWTGAFDGGSWTWTEHIIGYFGFPGPSSSVTSSADGMKLAACDYPLWRYLDIAGWRGKLDEASNPILLF